MGSRPYHGGPDGLDGGKALHPAQIRVGPNGLSQEDADVAEAKHVALHLLIDAVRHAAGVGHRADGRLLRQRLAVVGIKAGVVAVRPRQAEGLGQLGRHEAAHAVELLGIGPVAHRQRDSVGGGQGLDLGENVADAAAFHLDEPPADVEAAGPPQHALLIDGDVAGPAADVHIGDGRALFLGQGVGARPPGGEYRLQIRSGGGHHEVSGQVGQSLQHLVGVLLPGGFAGDDHRTRAEHLRRHAGRLVLLPHNPFDRLRVDLRGRTQGRKVDLAAVDHLFIHNVDARHGVAAGPVFDGQPAENELGRRGADIDAHAEDHFMQLASPAS